MKTSTQTSYREAMFGGALCGIELNPTTGTYSVWYAGQDVSFGGALTFEQHRLIREFVFSWWTGK